MKPAVILFRALVILALVAVACSPDETESVSSTAGEGPPASATTAPPAEETPGSPSEGQISYAGTQPAAPSQVTPLTGSLTLSCKGFQVASASGVWQVKEDNAGGSSPATRHLYYSLRRTIWLRPCRAAVLRGKNTSSRSPLQVSSAETQ